MKEVLTIWEKKIASMQSKMEGDLAAIRKEKAEVQALKEELLDMIESGYYLRDDKRIIISAPEIIIGNVDKSGVLIGASQVQVRGNYIGLEGVGNTEAAGGIIECKANKIHQIAVDTGIDGKEAVVGSDSEIIQQARSISINSHDSAGFFPHTPVAPNGCVQIHADRQLDLDASDSSELKKSHIESSLSYQKSLQSSLKKSISLRQKETTSLMKQLDKVLAEQEEFTKDRDQIRAGWSDMDDSIMDYEDIAPMFYRSLSDLLNTMYQLGETNRKIKELTKQKDAIKTGDAFKKETTDTSIIIRSEHIDLSSVDGDGNIRENEGAGLHILSRSVKIESKTAEGTLQENGSIAFEAENINISTNDTKITDAKSADIPAKGDVTITSKTFNVQAVDQEMKESKIGEKALTAGGMINLRAETLNLKAHDTEGKATGAINLSAKATELKGIDWKKEEKDGVTTYSDDKLAAGTTLVFTAEKVVMGSKDKADNKSKLVQLAAESVAVLGEKTTEVQQGEGKALVQLDGGNLKVSGSATEIYGKTTIQAATEIKGELKTPKATIDNVEAKSSFKSTNISDGIPIPPAPASASLSAKLKQEEVKAGGK